MSFCYITGEIDEKELTFCLYEVKVYKSQNKKETPCLKHKLIDSYSYRTKQFNGLVSAILRFLIDVLQNEQKVVKFACFSVSGFKLIDGGFALSRWEFVTETEIKQALKFHRVIFLNDIQACGYGTFFIKDNEFYQIQANNSSMDYKTRIFIKVEHGLEITIIKEIDNKLNVINVECDCKHFNPRDRDEHDLLIFIKKELKDECGIIFSEAGLYVIYKFLCQKYSDLENPEVTLKIINSHDQSKKIYNLALLHEDIICVMALKQLFGCYGSVVGNSVADFVTDCGVYIDGGYSVYESKLLDFLKDELLPRVFDERVTSAESIPVYNIKNPLKARLEGAKIMVCSYILCMSRISPEVLLELTPPEQSESSILIKYY